MDANLLETVAKNHVASATTRSLQGASFDHESAREAVVEMSHPQGELLRNDAGPLEMGAEQMPASEGELAQIVWLRGDEPWAGDFTMDAEAVMAELGIKRSRLTQISGKELRVGRMRVDRYVRPIYRALDVDTYKQWSRATATHQRSSLVLKEAAARLEEQGGVIEEKIRIASRDWVEALQSDVSQLTAAVQIIPEEIGAKWSGDLQAIASRIEDSMAGFHRASTEWAEQANGELRESMSLLSGESAKIAAELAGVGAAQASGQAAQAGSQAQLLQQSLDLLAGIDQLTKRIASLVVRQDEGAASAQAAFSGLAEALTLIIHHQKDQAAKADSLMQRRLADLGNTLMASIQSKSTQVSSPTATSELNPGSRHLIRARQLRHVSR